MSTSQPSSSTADPPPTSPTILLFARGVLALLDLWPALTIAVNERWGGPDSPEKKTWIASTIIDEFESRAIYLPTPSSAGPSTSSPQVDPKTAKDPPLDHDDLADLINQMMSDEFEANVEDGSMDAIAADILRLWRDLLEPSVPDATPESVVEALERKAAEITKRTVNASQGDGPVEVNEDGEEGDWTDSDSEEADEVPQLVPAAPTENHRQEPVIDEDGFELVQKGRKR